MIVVEVGAFGHELCFLISQPTLETSDVQRQESDRGTTNYVKGYLRLVFLDTKYPLWVFFDRDIETGVDEHFSRRRCQGSTLFEWLGFTS